MALGTLVAGDAHRRRRATDPGDLTTQPPGATKDPKWKTRTDRQPTHTRTQNHTQEAPSDTTRKPTGGSRLTRREELVDRGDGDLAEPADVDRADLAGRDELVELAAPDAQDRGSLHDVEDPALVDLQRDVGDRLLDLADAPTTPFGADRDQASGTRFGHSDVLLLDAGPGPAHRQQPDACGLVTPLRAPAGPSAAAHS